MNLDIIPQLDEGLEGNADSLEAPKESRVDCVETAIAIHKALEPEQQRRIETFTGIKKQLDGESPYSADELKKLGLASSSNTSWRDPEALAEEFLETYSSLSWYGVSHPISFEFTTGDPKLWPGWAKILADETRALLEDSDKFLEQDTLVLKDMIIYGTGVQTWPDEGDFEFEHVDIYRVKVPPRTKNSLDHLNYVSFDFPMTVQTLWEEYKNSDDKESSKWNKSAIGEALIAHSGKTLRKNEDAKPTMLDFQQAVKNNDITYAQRAFDEVPLVAMFVKEFDGTVSKFIFLPTQNTGEFLYKFVSQYKSVAEALFFYPFLPGEPELHGNKGMGHRTSACFEIVTRLDNNLADAGLRAATTYARTRTGRGRDTRQPRWITAGIMDIGEMEFAENHVIADIKGLLELSAAFRQKFQQNNNYVNYDPNDSNNKYKTLGEVQTVVTQGTRIQKNRAEHFYAYRDRMVRTLVRKILMTPEGSKHYKRVGQMKDRCKAKGVPVEFLDIKRSASKENFGLPEGMRVFATRAASSGSQVADQQETGLLMGMVNVLPPTGRNNLVADRIQAVRGSRGGFVERYMPADELPQKSFPEDSIITLENDALRMGGDATVAESNDDGAHIEGHLKYWFPYAKQAAEDSRMLQEAAQLLQQKVGPHIVQHLAKFGQDAANKQKFEEYQAAANQLANLTQQLVGNAKSQAEAQAREQARHQQQMADAQGMNTPSDPKFVKVLKDDERKRVELGKKDARENFKLVSDENRKNIKNESEIARDERKTEGPEGGRND